MTEVFVSHTSDLMSFPQRRSFVQAAIDAIVRARRVPVDMSYFTARSEQPATYCRQRVSESEVFVALIGFCYGSIVPESQVSYVELEFEEARAGSKVCLVFLLDEDTAVPRKLIDRDPTRIDDFRRRLQSSGLIIKTFATPEDLERALFQSLAELGIPIVDHTLPVDQQDRAGVDFDTMRESYLHRLMQNYRRLDLDALTPAEHDDQLPVLLQSVFVPNEVRADPPPMELSKELWRRLFDAGEIDSEELPEGLDLEMLVHARAAYGKKPLLPVLDVITAPVNRLVVLLGDPGSGKTTLARFLTLSLADESSSDLPSLRGWLPLLIELRAFADLRAECPSFLDYLDKLYTTEGLGLPKEMLESYLRTNGKTVVIFDGVDELFDPKEREVVSRQIAGFAARYPKIRIIVTSRIIGYRRVVLEEAGFIHFTLQDLNIDQISAFVERWYSLAMRDHPSEAALRKDRILRAVADSPSIRELAGNPLLLTILTIIGRRQELPRERRAVYGHAAAVLVEQWDVNRHLRDSSVQTDYIDREDRREMLRRVAAQMQAGRAGLAGNHIRGAELVQQFDSYLRGRYQLKASDSAMVARVMLKQFHTRNFILSRYGGDVYGFIHRAFLEYFCADEIVQRFESRRELSPSQLTSDIFGRHWADESWHEVLLLVAGMIDEKFTALAIDYLLQIANPQWRVSARLPALRHLSLAVRCLAEVRRLGDLTVQGQAVLDHVVDALRYSNNNSDWTITDAIEQDIVPIIAAMGPRFPGRERYRDWFLSGGNELIRTPVASAAASLLAALFSDSQEINSYLRMQALDAANAALRQAAVRALAQGWHSDSSTLMLLKECATEDSHGYVRQSAVQSIAQGWPTDPEIYSWVYSLATSSEDSYVRRGAVLALAQSWPGDKEAGLLLRQRIMSDSELNVRRGAANALRDGWGDDEDTLNWIMDYALHAGDGYIRAFALRTLAAHWSRDRLLGLLQERLSSDKSMMVREVAVRALASRWHGEEAILPVLRQRATKDSGGRVRRAAVQALGHGWRDDRGTLPLLRECAVFDRDWEVRRAAMQVLAVGWRNDPQTRRWLHEKISTTNDPTVRQAAIEALVVGWRDHTDTRPLLLERAVSDKDSSVRGGALQALADGWRDEEALLFVRERCEGDKEGEVREAAVHALVSKWRDHPVTTEALRGRATKDGNSKVRRAALQALAEGWSDDPYTFLLLSDMATVGMNEQIRRSALHAFIAAWRGDSDVLVLLQDRATVDEDWGVRRIAVEALAAEWADDPGTLPLLRERSVGDRDPSVRRAAVRAVANGWHDDAGTLPLLRERVVEDRGWVVREAAIRAVANGWHDDPGTLPMLHERAVVDGNGAVRRAAIRALANGWHDDPDTLRLLHARAEDDFWEVREAVVRALANGWHDDPDTLRLLHARAEDDSGEVREAVVRALAHGWHDDPDTLRLLHARAEDDSREVREAALGALSDSWRDVPRAVSLLQDNAINEDESMPAEAVIDRLDPGLARSDSVTGRTGV